jgi:lipopolysaccharide transport protein LptA
MADSPPDPSARLPRALLLAALLLVTAALDAASPRAQRPGANDAAVLNLDAAQMDIDTNSNRVLLKDVTISQGGVSIRASEAEAEAEGAGPRIGDSSWEFRGDVRIRFEAGNLDADKATVRFAGNRIARAEAQGSPAKMDLRLRNLPDPVRGEAGNIDYDVGPGRVTLTNGTWFSDGRNEQRSESLVFSIPEQRLQSGGDAVPAANGGGRIRLTIRPEGEPPATPPAESPVP